MVIFDFRLKLDWRWERDSGTRRGMAGAGPYPYTRMRASGAYRPAIADSKLVPTVQFWSGLRPSKLAVGARFELADGCPSSVFKTGALNRSATPPYLHHEGQGPHHARILAEPSLQR